MKVLFTVDFIYSVNISKAQIDLIIELQKKGAKITVLGRFSNEVKSILTSNNIICIALFPKRSFDFKFVKKVKSILAKEQFDIVQFLNGKTSRNVLLAIDKNNPIKKVSYMGSVSIHWYDPSALFTYLSPKLDKIICNSNYVYQHVKKQFFGKSKEKPVMIYKGYDSSWFKEIDAFDYSQLGIPNDAIIVTYVGNHRKVKGTKYFLESSFHLNSKKEIHYVVIGLNSDAPSLVKIGKQSPIASNIHFLGIRNDAVSLIKGSDIYAQTSITEGLGRAISEAMCVETPVVMTNAGGCTELIDETCGIITPIKDAMKIGTAISKLADNDTLRTEMGKNAKKRIDTVLSAQNSVDEYFNLYKNLLKHN